MKKNVQVYKIVHSFFVAKACQAQSCLREIILEQKIE